MAVRARALVWDRSPRHTRASSSSPSRPPALGRSPATAVAMLPASLLRRPGLGRLMRQARAYAEAAAAPAPAAGPGQMSFTFASPTQVRTPSRTPDSRPFPVWYGSELPQPNTGPWILVPQPPGRRPLLGTPDLCPSPVWSGSKPPNLPSPGI